MYYSNSTKTVTNRQVDLGDGLGYRTVAWNGEIASNYTTDGDKIVKVKFTFSDGSVKYSHLKIVVFGTSTAPLSSPGNVQAGGTFTCDFPHSNRSYTPDSFNGAFSSGQVWVDLANGRTTLTKPLIIVEGFDPENEFDRFDLGRKSLGGLGIDFGGSQSLWNEIRNAEDYDIVFLNFNNSTD